MTESNQRLPMADLLPRPITSADYADLTPEKLELWSGYLVSPPDWPEPRIVLLALLMVNVGLTGVVRLAPRQRWLEALDEAFGAAPG
jgi:hypothetical protein